MYIITDVEVTPVIIAQIMKIFSKQVAPLWLMECTEYMVPVIQMSCSAEDW